MEIIQTNALSIRQTLSIKTLQKLCFQLEGLANEPLLSNELNCDQDLPCFFLQYEEKRLVGFLSSFFPTGDEVEINAFVHPDFRRKGIFSSLAAQAIQAYGSSSFHQILFQVESPSESGKAYVEHRYPHIDRSEYRLKLSKSRWQEKRPSIPKLGTLAEASGEYRNLYLETATSLLREDDGFVQRTLDYPNRKGYTYLYDNKPLGVLQTCREDDQFSMLYGIAIDERYRGQGHGKAMLILALDTFFASNEYLSLEVDSQNPTAFGLYTQLGFEIEFQVDYHSLILS